MEPPKFGIVVLFVVLLAGSFGAGYGFLQSNPNDSPERAAPRAAVPAKAEPAPALVKEEPAEQPKPKPIEKPRTARPAPRRVDPPAPLTAAEATRMGKSCVGQRVTWVGKWTHSQSSGTNGSKHIFETQGSEGSFSFDFPFVTVDAKPLEKLAKGQNVSEHFDELWGPTRVVTVTGTIAGLEKVIFIGRGTREQVPVLTNITIQQ